jgi:hypothetical protein
VLHILKWIVLFIMIAIVTPNSKASPFINIPKEMNVIDFGVKGDGITDDTAAFQAAIDQSATFNRYLFVPALTYKISSKSMRYANYDAPDGYIGLQFPSNTSIYFERGAKLVLANNATPWTNVISIQNVNNIHILGYLEIDGRASTVTNGNEHMTGLFLYQAEDVVIQSANIHDNYGDNIFVGGTEDHPSLNVTIQYIKCTTAGRRNFVVHYVDKLHVGTAILDNTRGGTPSQSVNPAFSGYYSLDVEPDDYTGTKHFYQRFDTLSTIGQGNSFSVGTSESNAKNWVFDVGVFEMKIIKGAVPQPAFLHYGITFYAKQVSIQSLDHLEPVAYQTNYASFVQIGRLSIVGFNGRAMLLQSNGMNGKAHFTVERLQINGEGYPKSAGVRIEGSDLHISKYEAIKVAGPVLDVFTTSNNSSFKLDEMTTMNSGTDQLILLSDYRNNTVKGEIKTINVYDLRAAKVKRIVEFQTLLAMKGTTIGKINSPYGITKYTTTYGNFQLELK